MHSHRLIPVDVHSDARGSLTVLDDLVDPEFVVRRVYAIRSVPVGQRRGGHAHRLLRQVILPLVGAVSVRVDDGEREHIYRLDDPAEGLFLGPMLWRDLYDFTSDAVILVGASEAYAPSDYISDHLLFRAECAARAAAVAL